MSRQVHTDRNVRPTGTENPRSDLVIRPSFHKFRNRFFLALFVCGSVAVVDLLALSKKPAQQEMEAVAFALLAVVFGMVTLLVFQREEIKVADGLVTRRNLLGIPTRYPLEQIGGMTRRDVIYIGSPRPQQSVVVYDTEHRCLFQMSRPLWDPADIRRLHARLGGDGRTQLVTSSELDAEFPGAVPWVIRHPFTMIAIEFGVVLAIVVSLVVLIDALSHR